MVVRAPRLVADTGEVSGSVVISAGSIVAIEPLHVRVDAGVTVAELADDEVLLPGVVDSHVHVNEPGRTEWEGFVAATRGAAAGGVTTLVDMPLNSIPPTLDVEALSTKRAAARHQCFVDVGFWGGAVPGNLSRLRALHDEGVFGFKAFLLPSGVEEFGHLGAADLRQAMREMSELGALLLVHAEDADTIDRAVGSTGRSYAGFLASRPPAAEERAVGLVLDLARETGCRVHIVHVSSSEALRRIADARRHGVVVSAETCPHYLTFAAEDIADGATLYKCCPPIRERAHRDGLWEGLRDGTVDLVVSDHSPASLELKAVDTGDFGVAWGGISSLQVALPAVWTEAWRRGFALSDVSRWMSAGPARQLGLRTKGRLAPGWDADMVVFAPDESFVVDAKSWQHRQPLTPYDGRRLRGVVRSAWLRGRRVDLDDEPRGRLLRAGTATT